MWQKIGAYGARQYLLFWKESRCARSTDNRRQGNLCCIMCDVDDSSHAHCFSRRVQQRDTHVRTARRGETTNHKQTSLHEQGTTCRRSERTCRTTWSSTSSFWRSIPRCTPTRQRSGVSDLSRSTCSASLGGPQLPGPRLWWSQACEPLCQDRARSNATQLLDVTRTAHLLCDGPVLPTSARQWPIVGCLPIAP